MTTNLQHPIVADVMTDDQVISLWELHMRVASCTERTLKERGIVVRRLGRDLGKPVILAEKIDLLTWLGRPELAARTRVNYRSLLHTLYTLLQDEGHRLDNPAAKLPRIRYHRKEPDPFTATEVQKLLDCGIYGKTRVKVLLAAFQGMRAREIAAVAGEHIDWDRKRIWIAEGKGGLEVWRPMHPLVEEAAETMPRVGWWFPGTKNRANPDAHINPSSVSNTLSQALKRAGLERHRPHQLRSFFATELMKGGASTLVVQHAMRHANAATLSHYVKPDDDSIRAALDALPSVSMPQYLNRRGSALAEAGDSR